MALTTSRVSAATTATLAAGVASDTAFGTVVDWATLTNRDATVSVFLGASNVTTATGMELKAGESVTVWGLRADEDLYAIVAAGTVRVDVLSKGA